MQFIQLVFTHLIVPLFICSFPDVMLESYHVYSYSPIFFVIYLIITLYIIANVVRMYTYVQYSVAY